MVLQELRPDGHLQRTSCLGWSYIKERHDGRLRGKCLFWMVLQELRPDGHLQMEPRSSVDPA